MTKTWTQVFSDTEDTFRAYVPSEAVAYCTALHNIYGFSLRVSPPRRSKWGDYRFQRIGQEVHHAISVNNNLNPYAFLITYLHEVAHLRAFQQHGFKIPPHGTAWKQCFKELLLPVLSEAVFPTEVLTALRHYAEHPRASTGANATLTKALQPHSELHGQIPLHRLATGTLFAFRERTYVKQKVRRTRSLCEEVPTGKQYLILETTLVRLAD